MLEPIEPELQAHPGPEVTTLAIGEEGEDIEPAPEPEVTTLAIGEEGEDIEPAPEPELTTLAIGEEGEDGDHGQPLEPEDGWADQPWDDEPGHGYLELDDALQDALDDAGWDLDELPDAL